MSIFSDIILQFRALIHRNAEGFDVYDFRMGTIIGTFILVLISFSNHYSNALPYLAAPYWGLIVLQIVTILLSYRVQFIKQYANYIGNCFSIIYAVILITIIYQNQFLIEQTALSSLIVFGLTGMFKDRKLMVVYLLISFLYFISLVWLSDVDFEQRKFLTILAIMLFTCAYYVFNTKLVAIQVIAAHEKELMEREAWFRNIFDTAPIGIVLLNDKFKALEYSQQFYKLTGYSEIDLQDTTLFDLIHPDDRFTTFQFNLLREGDTVKAEQRMCKKDGTWTLMHTIASPTIIQAKPYTIFMFQDLSIERESQNKLRESAALLRSKNQALEDFSYVISHDLQEPLRMITSFSQLIQRRYVSQLDQDAKDDFNYVIDAAKRMSALIKDMLDYSRWSAKDLPIEDVDVNSVLNDALRNLTLIIHDSGAEVIAEHFQHINTNRLMLVQIFQNLIANSIKYRHPDKLPIVKIKMEKEDEKLIFSFSDNGMGIKTNNLERIFGIFQRGDIARDDLKSNGMGLAICKRLIERQGGHIWAESSLGEGATFYFTLPIL